LNPTSSSLVAQAIHTSIGILRLRKGPEDMPASRGLLLAAIAGMVLLRAAQYSITPADEPEANPVLLIGLEILMWLVCWAVALRIAGHPARFVQTATSLFGCQLVLAPVLLAVRALTVAYYDSTSTVALLVTWFTMMIAVWLFIVTVRILRSATEWPLLATVLLAFAIEAVVALVVLSQYSSTGLAGPVLPA
jgi:hypothetical protein